MSIKLNVLLAKTEHSAAIWKNLITNYIQFFKNKQGEFQGVRRTYNPRPDTIDIPSERGQIKVVSTVKEKLEWLEETSKEHIDNLFSVEATNASGQAKAQLVVDGVDFGELSSLELLRLKSLIESGDIEQLYANLPVRSDSEIWEPTNAEEYLNREIQQSPLQIGIKKSITKESYILEDPNVQHLRDASRYTPVVQSKDTILELGDYTIQKFSGETTHRKRAEILRRRSNLLAAVIAALKTANEANAVPSSVTAEKLFSFLHRGSI